MGQLVGGRWREAKGKGHLCAEYLGRCIEIRYILQDSRTDLVPVKRLFIVDDAVYTVSNGQLRG